MVSEKFLNMISAGGGAMVFGAFFFGRCFYFVDGGERALIFDRFKGIKQAIYGQGIHFAIPFLQWPIFFDIRTTPKNITSKTGTKDMQMVNIDLRFLYKPDTEYLPSIYLNLGKDYDQRVLPSIGNQVLKSIVAQYNAEQLLTQREEVSREIRERLTQRANEFHIILDDVAIVNLTFGPEFTSACEQKQVAQQEAERAKFLVQQREQERLAAIVRAEGQSESAKMISEAVAQYGQGLLEIRRIEAAKNIAAQLSRSPNITYIPGGSNNLLNIPLNNQGD